MRLWSIRSHGKIGHSSFARSKKNNFSFWHPFIRLFPRFFGWILRWCVFHWVSRVGTRFSMTKGEFLGRLYPILIYVPYKKRENQGEENLLQNLYLKRLEISGEIKEWHASKGGGDKIHFCLVFYFWRYVSQYL